MGSRWILVGALASLTACAGGSTEGVPPARDSGTLDTGNPVTDTGNPVVDTGNPVADTGPMDSGPGVNCLAITQCGLCASIGPCGWCGANNTCLPGNASGPSAAGVCAGGWAGTALSCPLDAGTPDSGVTPPTDTGMTATDAGGPDPCATSNTCGTCTARSECGYCGATMRCQTGSRSGPVQGPSCASGWSWLTTECGATGVDAGDPCASATNCATCTGRAQCGWCPTAGRCLVGSEQGPNTSPGQCGRWAWYTGACGGGPVDAGAVDSGPRDTGNPVTDTGPRDSGPPDVPGGMGIGGFGVPSSFPAGDVQRACPQGATVRLQIARVYAQPTQPNGTPWDSIPGVTDFVCQGSSDRIRELLRDQINGIRMGTGDQADAAAGEAFRQVISQQCGNGLTLFLGRWAGPDMYAVLTVPPATTPRWRTPTENDAWIAPREGVMWNEAIIEAPCADRSTTRYQVEIRDEDLFTTFLRMGATSFTLSEVSPRGLCTGWAWREGFDGIAGMLFRVSVRGGTQDCQGLR